MFLAGSSVVAGKIMLVTFPVFLASGLRFVVASFSLLVLMLIFEKHFPILTRKDYLILFLQAFFGIFLFNVLLLFGLKISTAINSGIITSTTPVFIALIAHFFLKERLSFHTSCGIFLTMIGIFALQLLDQSPPSPSAGNNLVGNLMVLGAVISEALFMILGKTVSSRLSPLIITTHVSIFGLLLFAPFAVFESIGFDFTEPTLLDYTIILYYGIAVTVIAFLLWYKGLSIVPAGTAAVFTGVLPASAIFLSIVLLNEAFTWIHLIGGLCIVLGCTLPYISRTK